jgi:carboxymethylenebutenolidase
MVRAGAQDSVRVWIVYPQRKSNAPVVVVVHEIYGLTPWVRAVADQLAAEGFLAIAPDLLTTKNIPGFPDSIDRSAAIAAMGTLQSADVQRQLNAVADFALSLPGTTKKYGIIGFCRGGDISFQHALFSSRLSASVVFYGRAPANASFKSISAPILGLYGGSDTRVDATILPTDSAMKQAGKIYEYHIYDGAGHGFLRQQTGMDGANAAATARSWPEAIAWFHKYLGS